MKYTFNHDIENLVSKKDGKVFTPTQEELDSSVKKEIDYIVKTQKRKLDEYDLTYDMKNFKYDEAALLAGDEEQIKYAISVLKSDYSLQSKELYKSDIITLNYDNRGYNNYREAARYDYSLKGSLSYLFSFKVYEYLLNSKYFMLKEKAPKEKTALKKTPSTFTVTEKESVPKVSKKEVNTESIVPEITTEESVIAESSVKEETTLEAPTEESTTKAIIAEHKEEDNEEVVEDYLPEDVRKLYDKIPVNKILTRIAYNFICNRKNIDIEDFIKSHINIGLSAMISTIYDISDKLNNRRNNRYSYNSEEDENSDTEEKTPFDEQEVLKKYLEMYVKTHGEDVFDNMLTKYFDQSSDRFKLPILNLIHELKIEKSLYYSKAYKGIDIKKLENALEALKVSNKANKYYDLLVKYIKYFNTSEMAMNFMFNYDFFNRLPVETTKNDKFKEIVDLLKDSDRFLRGINYYEKGWNRCTNLCKIVDECKIKASGAVSALSEEDAKKHLFDIVAKYYPENEKVIKALLDK